MSPFTLEHFKFWASQLVLDSGDPWILEPFQEQFIEDVFSEYHERNERRLPKVADAD